MASWRDSHLKRDLIKLMYVLAAIMGLVAIFVVTPTLSTPALLSVVITMLLSPVVKAFERRGYSRTVSIILIFAVGGGVIAGSGVWSTQSVMREWGSLRKNAPAYFEASVAKLKTYETDWKSRYPFLETVNPTDQIVRWGEESGKSILTNGPALVGDLLTWFFIVPILTFVLLNDGPAIRKKFFELVPNRFFETTFMVSTRILASLSDYVRAKLVEAFLVGLCTTLGLLFVDAPYAVVLGIIAGVTNIVPYLGPIIGAVPGVAIAALDPNSAELLVPVILVYLIANLVDMAFIFPVLVAKLVDLHPLVLLVVVILGQQYYGVVGMLVSIPIATALKVVFQELHGAVYENRRVREPDPSESVNF